MNPHVVQVDRPPSAVSRRSHNGEGPTSSPFMPGLLVIFEAEKTLFIYRCRNR